MYTKFFGLHEKPFTITPDPRYLYMSERHGEGLAHLVYGVTESGGFIQLTGEVGTGKTTLVRTLLGQIPAEADVALILNPQLSALEFLSAICEELKIELPPDRSSPKALVDTLNRHLLDAHSRGRRTILLVDEAQNLADDVLEQLRLLTNLETARQKLLQIILIAQPELRDKLSQTNLRQLAQRVTGRYHLEPLTKEDAIQYIDHRLKVAGALGEIFEPAAKREVYRMSGGIPRLINVICDRAMLGAYSSGRRSIDRKLVRRAATEVSGKSGARLPFRWALPAAAALAVAATGGMWYAKSVQSTSRGELTSEVGATAAIVPEAPPVQAESRAVLARNSPVSPDNSTVAAESPPVDQAVAAPLVEQLRDASPSASYANGMAGLTALWTIEYDRQEGPACRQVAAQGLSCLSQRGTWTVLRQLDRPVLLTITDADGNSYRPVLISLDESTAELSFGDSTRKFSLTEISDLWFGQYMMIWRPPNGIASSIKRGMRDDNVRWLRQSLATLDGATVPQAGDPNFFDAELERRLMDFQRQHRLEVDGLAGQQTQIIINSLLAQDGTPRLTSSH